MELIHSRSCGVVVFTSGVRCSVTLGEEVGLELVGVTPDQLDIDLVQIITLKIERRNDAGSLCSLHDHFHLAEHDVEVGFDGGVVESLVDSQL